MAITPSSYTVNAFDYGSFEYDTKNWPAYTIMQKTTTTDLDLVGFGNPLRIQINFEDSDNPGTYLSATKANPLPFGLIQDQGYSGPAPVGDTNPLFVQTSDSYHMVVSWSNGGTPTKVTDTEPLPTQLAQADPYGMGGFVGQENPLFIRSSPDYPTETAKVAEQFADIVLSFTSDTAGAIFPTNNFRSSFIIRNEGPADLYILFRNPGVGDPDVSLTNYSEVLAAGETFRDTNRRVMEVRGIFAAAGSVARCQQFQYIP